VKSIGQYNSFSRETPPMGTFKKKPEKKTSLTKRGVSIV